MATKTWITEAVHDPTGLIRDVHWRCNGVGTTANATLYGQVYLDAGDINDPGFVPFPNVDQATLLGWMEASTADEEDPFVQADIEAGIDNVIANKEAGPAYQMSMVT